ncbi:MAG: phospholipid carrier-dependent glycosyltransferase [Thermoflexales bacterium]|nr:phospholipid carrier-dependent glycosyltransferase [Thermoflexales bacterium]
MRIGKTLYTVLMALALVVFIAYFAIYVMYAGALFRFPLDYDQGEGFELNDAILFSQGQWPYRDNEAYPFYASNYPPLFHLMMVPLVWILGRTLLAGRILSFAATLVVGAVVGWIVMRKTRQAALAALCGLMVFASNYIYHVGPLARLHLTMVMFELLAIAVLAEIKDAPGGKGKLLLGLALLTCAGWTKQLALATVVAAFVYLLWRWPRQAFKAGLGFALVNGALFLAINLATGGQWFVNIIQANVNAYDIGQALWLYRQCFQLHGVLIVLSVAYVVYELVARQLSLYSIWFVAAVANSALAGKWGAGESYFTTAVVAACVLSGLALGRIANSKFQISSKFVIPLAFLLQAVLVLHLPTDGRRFAALADLVGVGRQATVYAGYSYYDSGGYTQLGHLLAPRDLEAAERLLAYVRDCRGPALTEEATLAILAGKEVVTNPTQLLNLYNNGLYDPASLIAMVEARQFCVVVLRAQFYPPPLLEAVGQAYQTVDQVPMNGFVYRVLKAR